MRPVVRVAAMVLSAFTLVVFLPVLACVSVYAGSWLVEPWLLILFGVALAGCAVTLWSVSQQVRPQPASPEVVNQSPGPSRAELLEEYKLAQASAEHHDKLLWSTTGIVWGASLVLLGIVFKDLRAIPEHSPRVLLSLLGIALTIGVWWMTTVWNTVMRVKYERCQELERLLGFRQHINVHDAYPRGRMSILYAVISFILLGTWLGVLCI
jgi:hypothetical protein